LVTSEQELDYIAHINYGQLSKSVEEDLDSMEFEGKKKLLIGEVQLTAFSVHGNVTVKKSSEIWLEIDFKKKGSPKPKEKIVQGVPYKEDSVPLDVITFSNSNQDNDSKMTEEC